MGQGEGRRQTDGSYSTAGPARNELQKRLECLEFSFISSSILPVMGTCGGWECSASLLGLVRERAGGVNAAVSRVQSTEALATSA